MIPDKARQRRRVIRLLTERGADGITQRDFLLPHVADGGPPIARLASRIDELRHHDGLDISDAGWRDKYRIYRLDQLVEAHPCLFDQED